MAVFDDKDLHGEPPKTFASGSGPAPAPKIVSHEFVHMSPEEQDAYLEDQKKLEEDQKAADILALKLDINAAFAEGTNERKYLFGNLFHGTVVPASSSLFFSDPEPEERDEIKGADVSIRGSDQPHQVIYGECKVGGVLTFVTTDIPLGGEYIHFTNAIAGHEVKAVTKMYVDDVEVPLGLTGDHIYFWSTGAWQLPPLPAAQVNGYVFASVSDGTTTQAVNSDLKSQSDALFPGIITTNHRSRGVAYVYNILYFSPDFFPQGFPKIKYLVQGHAGIYDPRTDSTGYSSNAALCIGEFLSNSDYGMRGTWGVDIDVENFKAAADVCDENVLLADGVTTEKRYTCNGVFQTSQNPEEILRQLQTTIGGPIVYSGGKWKCFPGTWRTPTLTITEDDIVGPIELTTGPTRQDLYNGVTGTYLSADAGYEITDFPAVTNSLYEDQDGEQILKDFTFPFTTSAATAQRLSKLALERHRQSFEIEIVCKLKAFQAQIADNIYLDLNDPRFDLFGFDNKEFEVMKSELVVQDGAIACRLLLKETAEAIFSWNYWEETTYDLAENTTLPDPTVVSDPTGLTVQSGTQYLYRKLDGTVVTRAYLSWDSTLDPYVKNDGQIQVRARNDSAGESFRTIETLPGDQTDTYIWDVSDGAEYTFSIRYRNGLGVTSEWIDEQHSVKGKEAPPSIVTGLTAVPTEYGITFSWSDIPDPDRGVYVLLYGEDRANAFTYSEQFDQSAWTKVRSSVSANATEAPDENDTADKLVEDSTASQTHEIQETTSTTLGITYRFSVFAKAAERTWFRMHMGVEGFASAPYAHFDVGNGAVGTIQSGVDSATIEDVGNGWYRCTAIATADATDPGNTVQILLATADDTVTYSGDGSSGLYLWGAQWQELEENGRYVKTEGAAVTNTGAVEIFRGQQTTYPWPIQVAASYAIKLYAIDTTGNISIVYTELSVTVSGPGFPQNVMSTISGPDILLTWEAPTQTQFAVGSYQITKDSVIIGSVLGTTFKYRADYGGSATFGVTAVDVKGNLGSEAALDVDIVVPGKVTNVVSKVIDNNVLFFFDPPTTGTLPIERYDLRKGEDFGLSTDVATTSKEYFQYFETLGGLYSFWIVPIDTALNEGVPCQQFVNLFNPPDFVLHNTGVIDPANADTFTNALETEDPAEDAFYAPVVTGRTWTQHFTDNSYTTVQNFIDDGYAVWLEPAETSDAVVEEKIDLGTVLGATIINTSIVESTLAGAVTVTAEISYSDDDVSYISGGSGNNPILATNVRYIKTKYTLSNTDDKSLSEFSAWTYTAQVKTVTDSGEVEVTTNGQTVTFNLDFIAVDSLTLTVEGTTAKFAVYDNTGFPDDFDVYIFNDDGTDGSGSGIYVSWVARGAISVPGAGAGGGSNLAGFFDIRAIMGGGV